MKTSRRRVQGREGFTLVEVLAALVILAVGLLGLEALGIYAARSVVRAERQSEFALDATRVVEATVDTIERSLAAQPACGVVSFGAATSGGVVRRTVQGADRRRTVRVEVLPAAGSALMPDTFLLVTHVFVPNATPC